MDKIEQAFQAAPRHNFLPETVRAQAGWDAPLPIGFGQTNSQPSTVGLMLDWLDVQPGDKILDVGSGSGWTTALLANLTGPAGRVYAVELVPELVEFGRQNCEQLGIKNARFYQAGPQFGLPGFAPYDRILVSASAAKLPEELQEQLGPNSKMVIPVGNDMLEIKKDSNGKIELKEHPEYFFTFVPLVKN